VNCQLFHKSEVRTVAATLDDAFAVSTRSSVPRHPKPELVATRECSIPSTTTMLTVALRQLGLDPSYAIGGGSAHPRQWRPSRLVINADDGIHQPSARPMSACPLMRHPNSDEQGATDDPRASSSRPGPSPRSGVRDRGATRDRLRDLNQGQ
jgi:hypothetical protein